MALRVLFILLALLVPRAAGAVNPGEILVADFAASPNPSRIIRFNASGNVIGVFADDADGLVAPRDMAFASNGNLYVADNASVLIFDGNGNPVGSITAGLTKAVSLAFRSNGELFVSNRIGTGSSTSQILRYSSSGTLLQTWNIPEFDSGGNKPFAREIVFGPDGLLYLCLRGNNNNSNDNLVATLNTSTGVFASFAASAQHVTQPIGLVFEPGGSLLVTNDTGTQTSQTSLIVRLSSSGTWLGDFWNQGAARDLVYDGFGQLHSANRTGGVFLWQANGTLKKEYGTEALISPIGVALIPASAPYCQNEILEVGEQCDDGNATPCDGCSAACLTERCGDGVLCPALGEVCDDGNTAACDGCSPACKPEQCGNGIVDCNEQCDDANATDCDGCTSCRIDELAYLDSFENGTNGWDATGLWNQDTFRSVSPTHAWYYGQPSTRNYQTFFPPENAGSLISPVIDLSRVSGASLQFSYFLQTENHPGVDVSSVQISRDGFVSDVTTLQSPLPDQGAFTSKVYDLQAFCGSQIQILFGFDTMDGNANNFEGFYVDDVAIRGTGAPVCGNGLAAHACGEGCDDGNTLNGDGCSSSCQAEGVMGMAFFSGTGQGGAIHITVSGVALNVATAAGDSSVTVASKVAGAINANATLQAMRITATWSGSRTDVLVGTITSLSSADPGIQASTSPSIPLLSGPGLALLALLLALAARSRLRGLPRNLRAR